MSVLKMSNCELLRKAPFQGFDYHTTYLAKNRSWTRYPNKFSKAEVPQIPFDAFPEANLERHVYSFTSWDDQLPPKLPYFVSTSILQRLFFLFYRHNVVAILFMLCVL